MESTPQRPEGLPREQRTWRDRGWGWLERRATWIGVLAVSAVCLLFSLGLQYTPDSLHYLSVAHGVASGEGLTGSLLAVDLPIPRPLDLWPPLYPLALAAGLGLGLGADAAAILVNVLSMALLAAALFRLAPAGRQGRYLWTCAALIILYRPFCHVVGYAWSEPLCVALLAVVLAIEVRAGDASRLEWISFWEGVTLGGAVLTRYAALFVLPGLVLSRLLRLREQPRAWRAHAAGLALLGAGALLVITPWLVRNLRLFGGLLGTPHVARDDRVIDSLLSGVNTLLGDASYGAFGLLCLASVLGLGLSAHRSAGGAPASLLQRMRPAALVSLSYAVFLFFMAARTHMDTLDNRLLAPLGVGLIPLASALLVELLERAALWRAPVLMTTGVLVIAGHLWAPVRERMKRPLHGLEQLRERIAPLPDWVAGHVTERDLLLGPQLWYVHPFSPAPVMAHGYPERGFMTAETLGPFLKEHRRAYERFFWVDVKPPPVSLEEFEIIPVAQLAREGYWSTVWNAVWRIQPRDPPP
jgi:hypothetical protein